MINLLENYSFKNNILDIFNVCSWDNYYKINLQNEITTINKGFGYFGSQKSLMALGNYDILNTLINIW